MKLGTATTLCDGKLTYNNTVVCEDLGNGRTRLNSGGFRTATTKRRMNQYAEAMGHEWHILQVGDKWRVRFNSPSPDDFYWVSFHDLMQIDSKMFGDSK